MGTRLFTPVNFVLDIKDGFMGIKDGFVGIKDCFGGSMGIKGGFEKIDQTYPGVSSKLPLR